MRALVSPRQSVWAVLLAGGDGVRLQTLTRKIAGDSRPKQFCRIFGGQSLLRQTLDRIGPIFRADRTMFVVTKAHERFYQEDLRRTNHSRILAQPQNRGTAVAMAATLRRIAQYDSDAAVAFFPCDHYYSDDEAFASTVRAALAFSGEHPASHPGGRRSQLSGGRIRMDRPGIADFDNIARHPIASESLLGEAVFAEGSRTLQPRLSVEHVRNHRPGTRLYGVVVCRNPTGDVPPGGLPDRRRPRSGVQRPRRSRLLSRGARASTEPLAGVARHGVGMDGCRKSVACLRHLGSP